MSTENTPKMKETPLRLAAKKLPVYSHKDSFMRALDSNKIMIIVGETGSGKTTQIPQWCHEYCKSKSDKGSPFKIACTQPRRIAAMSVAARVAEEMGATLGQEVGYSVRFDSLNTHKTSLKYLTDGMLLREAMIDNNLKQYNIIILDEAHERTLQTEILIGVVKRALIERSSSSSEHPKLKIIIMSATLNVKLFKNFFPEAYTLKIPGRQFQVQNYFACQKQSDMLMATLIAVFQLHKTCEKGDILVFCSGQDEIHTLVTITHKVLKLAPKALSNLIPLPLYAALPAKNQMKIFEVPVQHDKDSPRRVIYSTNVAETSITVPNIKYVIDTGLVKTKTYCPKTGLESLKLTTISKSQALQRTGRSGRVGSGSCYRLYTEEDFAVMPNDPVPEIQRCNLDGVLLQLISIGIKDVESFDFLERPDIDRLQQSLKQLIDLKAIKKTITITNGNGHGNGYGNGYGNGHAVDGLENGYGPSTSKKPHLMTNGHSNQLSNNYRYELTPLGKQISSFPLSPNMGKVLIVANQLGCVEEALTIISLLYIENLFIILPNNREKAEKMLDKFRTNEGDLIMLLKVYRAFRVVQKINKRNIKKWCAEHFICIKNLQMACYVRKQLLSICKTMKIESSSCGRETALVRRAFTYGFVNNIAKMWNGKYKNKNDQEIEIHPSSCLFKCRPECIMYVELTETNKCYMKNCTIIEQNWVREALTSSTISPATISANNV